MVAGQHSAPTTISSGERHKVKTKNGCAKDVCKSGEIFFFFTAELLNTTPILFCKQQ
jgi:hypothetical protein